MHNTIIINSIVEIGVMVDLLVLRLAPILDSPIMYIDLEGVALCREGSLSIFTLLLDEGKPVRTVYLIECTP
jgi:exonuclease 3'-5' domain-containing protein 1